MQFFLVQRPVPSQLTGHCEVPQKDLPYLGQVEGIGGSAGQGTKGSGLGCSGVGGMNL